MAQPVSVYSEEIIAQRVIQKGLIFSVNYWLVFQRFEILRERNGVLGQFCHILEQPMQT